MPWPDSAQLLWQMLYLLLLALPVATVAWTITHEEVLHEVREYCQLKSERCRHVLQRKFFYVLTCEYCLSHYAALLFVLITGFRFLVDWWMGYVLALFALVWVANMYMSLFARLRVDIRSERAEADIKEVEAEAKGRQTKGRVSKSE